MGVRWGYRLARGGEERPFLEPADPDPGASTVMGVYGEYLEKNLSFEQLVEERKKQLERISTLRGGRAVLVFAANLSAQTQLTSIGYPDLLPIVDQLSNLQDKAIRLDPEPRVALSRHADAFARARAHLLHTRAPAYGLASSDSS